MHKKYHFLVNLFETFPSICLIEKQFAATVWNDYLMMFILFQKRFKISSLKIRFPTLACKLPGISMVMTWLLVVGSPAKMDDRVSPVRSELNSS